MTDSIWKIVSKISYELSCCDFFVADLQMGLSKSWYITKLKYLLYKPKTSLFTNNLQYLYLCFMIKCDGFRFFKIEHEYAIFLIYVLDIKPVIISSGLSRVGNIVWNTTIRILRTSVSPSAGHYLL